MLARLLHHVTVMQISGDNDRLKDKSEPGRCRRMSVVLRRDAQYDFVTK
ncbi:MAG: hypothetical protein JWO26_974 [Rhodospirillales bacterium]|nr:hypothetical protein [Rhodospirillales bacterium]